MTILSQCLGRYHRTATLLASALFFWLGAQSHALTVFDVSINTTALSGQNGKFAFDLIGGDAAAANNTATISASATNGTLGNSSSFALTDTGFFNEVLRDITFGTSLSFTLQLTENRTAPGFDQFSFFLLNAAGTLPLFGTTDPLGANALFAIDINGQAGGAGASFAAATPGISWQISRAAGTDVPEGGNTLWLSFGAMTAIVLLRGRFKAEHF